MQCVKYIQNSKYLFQLITVRNWSSAHENLSCKVAIIGGGAGGCSMAAKLCRKLGKNKVVIIEPSDTHYYQPLFTLIGGGLKTLVQSHKPMANVLPKDAIRVTDTAQEIDPENCIVYTLKGLKVQYEYLIIAVGIRLDYDKIPGLLEGLQTEGSGVCSIYSPHYVEKTFLEIKRIKSGNAVFTFPNTPVKCAGAPQKIMYLAEDYLKKNNIKDINIIFNTSLDKLFSVKKYSDALWSVVNSRNIKVNTNHNLINVNYKDREAVFAKPDGSNPQTFEYSFLHVTPPQSSPDLIKKNKMLSNALGFLNVDQYTLQHVQFKNIFGIGDCTSVPTSKTAAAVAAQTKSVFANLTNFMDNQTTPMSYDGYTSCPLVTGGNKCILAEFDYSCEPLETFPVNQAKERRSMFYLKSYLMPELYWYMLLRGYWGGPGLLRKMLHLGMSR